MLKIFRCNEDLAILKAFYKFDVDGNGMHVTFTGCIDIGIGFEKGAGRN